MLMLACTILGIIWLSVSLYNYLTVQFGPIAGPAICGAVLFIPIIIYGILKVTHHKDKRSKKERMFDEAFANSSVGSLSRMIETMSAHSPFAAAAVAIIGGFLASRFPQFLSIFAELVHGLGDELDRRRVRRAAPRRRRPTSSPPPSAAAAPRRICTEAWVVGRCRIRAQAPTPHSIGMIHDRLVSEPCMLQIQKEKFSTKPVRDGLHSAYWRQ
ncbi:MAG: hypothetical protein JF615_01735 [Asticcacaulis sp.]|nr:hypothetical protein [Asticcacaulis sp.]